MYYDKKYRPKTLGQFFGNSNLKTQIKNIKKDKPSLILLHGTSGCGKTTLARIIANKLNYEMLQFNVSDAGGIDLARSINEMILTSSMFKEGKAFILNEMQGANKNCMNALLEALEEPPKNIIFIMCTTEPQVLLHAVKTRAVLMEVKPLDENNSIKLLSSICKKENLKFPERTLSDIYFAAIGIPRQMLIILNEISKLKKKEDISEIIELYGSIGEGDKLSVDIARSLLKKESFKVVMTKLKLTKDQPETIRRVICSYMSKVLSNGTLNKDAALILDVFISCNTSIGMSSIIHSVTLLYIG